jgi:hypothetical protein
MPGIRFKALTVVLMTMAVTLPGLTIPAAAVLPAQIGVVGNSRPSLDSLNLLTEVRHSYGRGYHGNYYNYRRHRYNNYYGNRYYRYGGGRYYNYGWPYYGGIGLGYGFGYDDGLDYYNDGYNAGGSHVQWCLNRYRSYNPRTNTYMGYDGYRHRCNSPY